MIMLTTTEIDRELASRATEVAAISTTLVDLDSHPGLGHLRRYPPVGITANRWPEVETALGRLWEDHGTITAIVDAATRLRGARPDLGDDTRAALTRLLRERSFEPAVPSVPSAQRELGASPVRLVGLADTIAGMRSAYRSVAEFLDAVDEVDTRVAKELAPVLKQLDHTGAAAPQEISDLLALAATDPLSLTADKIERRMLSIAESVAMLADWPQAVAGTAALLDELREAVGRARHVRSRAERGVITQLPTAEEDTESVLREVLRSITTADPRALGALRRRIAEALRLTAAHERTAQGLLDRRSELAGRLTAYQAKARRLGLARDPELASAARIAAGLLSRQPCDLAAVTRAVLDYQQILAAKREMAT